eukprot:4312451-Ditylum_brightwellii.AAC.1
MLLTHVSSENASDSSSDEMPLTQLSTEFGKKGKKAVAKPSSVTRKKWKVLEVKADVKKDSSAKKQKTVEEVP